MVAGRYGAAVRFDDALGDGQPKARPAAAA
jgi:hypothetical protein